MEEVRRRPVLATMRMTFGQRAQGFRIGLRVMGGGFELFHAVFKLPAKRLVPIEFGERQSAHALDALVPAGGERLQHFQRLPLLPDGQRQLAHADGQFRAVRFAFQNDPEAGDFVAHFIGLVPGAGMGFQIVQRAEQPVEFPIRPLQHRRQCRELPADRIRHFHPCLIKRVVADVRRGVFQQGPHLNLRLQPVKTMVLRAHRPQEYIRYRQRKAQRPELCRIDLHDVMHRAVAELRGLEPGTGVFAVRPVHVERLFDEGADAFHLPRGLRDDPRSTQVGHPHQGIRRERVFGIGVQPAFAENFIGEARNGFRPGTDDGQRRVFAGRLAQYPFQKQFVFRVIRPDLLEPRHMQRHPVFIREFYPRGRAGRLGRG